MISDLETSMTHVPKSVTSGLNEILTLELSAFEVKTAYFAIHPKKAFAHDWMTALFYQKFWHIIRAQVVNMVQNIMTSGIMDSKSSKVNICLIPKTERPRAMKEFRPISLCNVSYKIISKVLCQRLKQVLPSLVSEKRSAFVAWRVISDNILVAQEAFHALNTKDSCKTDFIAIKTDMSKAYDIVEWCFLETLMRKMSFAESWICWIMTCVNFVSYRVLLSGKLKGSIIPTRGLRQEDPLSP